MNPFDVYMWHPPQWPEPHPAVIVSHPDRAARKDWVEVVLCSTQRAGRKCAPHEIILDETDGLDWPTLCKCDLIYAVHRDALGRKKGRVAEARQSPLIRTVLAAHNWASVL